MISKNDLYDIAFAWVLVRSDIQYELNKTVLTQIKQVLACRKQNFEDNQIRKAIASIENLDHERWYYVYHNNVYVNQQLLENEQIYHLLIKLCNMLTQLLEKNNFEKAYDLADCIHCLPNIIAENNLKIPKSYWKIHLKKYRNQWDRSFLKEEEKYLKL